MLKVDQLIRTKLHLPFTRPRLVSRSRLQERIAQGLCGPLTLITAPAGFGKTTLVVSTINHSGMPVAWLSLDKEDNHISRFLSYVIAAIKEVDNTIGSEAAQFLTASQQMPSEIVLTSLINDLDSASNEMVLVLDDYHVISSQAVHEKVAFLLDNCPRHFHLLISTRSDPPLPLARLRARGQTVELRAADLRFTENESAQFLNDVMGLCLDAGSVAVLEERTEGWIAGLQMAALSMRDRKDVRGFIEAFSGTNRYILDYLLEEILTNQPPEIQRFLLFTSILERLTVPLCDAVLATGNGSKGQDEDQLIPSEAHPQSQSAAILEYMERSNLFLVPLDDERRWYRYHHLFADLLRARLDLVYPGLAKQLHMGAMGWLEQAKITVEAVNQALAAGAHNHAARLVEENTTRLLAQGELNILMSWIDMLPAELRQARPWLCIHQAYAMLFAAQTAKVEQLLTLAETALGANSMQHSASYTSQTDKTDHLFMSVEESRALQGAVATARAFKAVITGKDIEALAYLQDARELLTAENIFEQILAAYVLGHTMLTLGRLPEAHSAFNEYIRLGRTHNNPWVVLAGQSFLAQVYHAQGQLPQARAILKEALTEASQRGVSSRGYIARAKNGLASVLYEQNEIEAAERLLTEAIELTRNWPNPNHLVYSFTLLARVQLAQGYLEEARTTIEKADQKRRNANLPRRLNRAVDTEMIRVWLALQAAGARFIPGNLLAEQCSTLVTSWKSELANLAASDSPVLDECVETAALTLARVSLASGRAEEALNFLEPVTRNAQTAGHNAAAIGSLVLSAIAWQGKNVRLAEGARLSYPGFIALEKALSLAEPGGFVRTFLDEGHAIQTLLANWLVHVKANPVRDYANHLLTQFNTETRDSKQPTVPVVQDKHAQKSSIVDPDLQTNKIVLVEPLSQRELEVLALMALGRTNQAIARQLVVATGTIKAHASNIFRKLDVANRTEAVNRARQLGILP